MSRIVLNMIIKNPFEAERLRQRLAKEKKYKELIKTYTSALPEIKDLNTGKFWDGKVADQKLSQEDGMTQDRIKAAYSFIPKNPQMLLDIGAGFGYIEELLSKEKSIKLYANDISQRAIDNLKKKYIGNFEVASIYTKTYKESFFDTILALEVLEHIPPSKILNVLKKIKRILKKNGLFILSIPTNEGLELMTNNPNGHVRLYTKELITAELVISGFKVVDIKQFYAFSKLYTLKKILTKLFPKKWQPNDIVVLAKSL